MMMRSQRRGLGKAGLAGVVGLILGVFGTGGLGGVAGVVGTTGIAAAQEPRAAVGAPPAGRSQIPLERFMRIRTPGAPSVAPDGTLYVRDWPQGVFQLFRVHADAAAPGVPTTQLTDFADGLAGFTLSPAGDRILLLHNAGGNENNQISLLTPARPRGPAGADRGTDSIVPLLDNPRVQYSVNHWLPDGSGFLFTGNEESPADFHIYRWDFAPTPGNPHGSRTKLLDRPGAWSAADITRDGSRVLVGQFRSISDTSIFELNTATGTLTDLGLPPPQTGSADAGPATVGQQLVGYMPDEASVLLIADVEDGMPKLFRRDLADGTISKPLPTLDQYEIDDARINRERTLLAVVTNEDGFGVLHLFRLPSFEPVALPPIDRGVVWITALEGDRLTWTLSNARTPGLAFTWTVPPAAAPGSATPPAAPRQLTFADTQGIDLNAFALPELIRYRAFDGLEIPAFLFLPPGHTPGTPIPFIANYHGGPEAQFRPSFSREIQFLLANGFGVIQPNVRGSTGYGRRFHMLDNYTKRWDSVRDGVDAVEWLVANGFTRPGLVASWGGSYGGFMAVATLIEDQERVDAGKRPQRLFGAGITVVGIVNFRTFLEQTADYRRKLREAEYGPLTDPEFLDSVSPLNRIDKINVPVMIAHGLNDPRVPIGEAMQLAVGLMRRGLDPVQVYFPDEGHGFAKLSNRLVFTQRMVRFLKQTIGNEPPAPATTGAAPAPR